MTETTRVERIALTFPNNIASKIIEEAVDELYNTNVSEGLMEGDAGVQDEKCFVRIVQGERETTFTFSTCDHNTFNPLHYFNGWIRKCGLLHLGDPESRICAGIKGVGYFSIKSYEDYLKVLAYRGNFAPISTRAEVEARIPFLLGADYSSYDTSIIDQALIDCLAKGLK